MDKNLALVIKEQLIGEYAGHMASIPHNPVLHSIFMMLINNYRAEHKYKPSVDQSLALILSQMAEALDHESPTQQSIKE